MTETGCGHMVSTTKALLQKAVGTARSIGVTGMGNYTKTMGLIPEDGQKCSLH